MYPSQPSNFLVPYGPGGSIDAYVRKFSELLTESLTPHVNVEPINMPGASGQRSTSWTSQAPCGWCGSKMGWSRRGKGFSDQA